MSDTKTSDTQTSASETVLAIDTTGARLQLALLHAGGSDVSIDDIGKGHAELLFPRLDALLSRNALTYADLNRIAVTTGPGSFTGLRVGLSAARGLGLALDIPVVGVSTLMALSLLAPKDTLVAVIIDAKRGEIYRQEFYGPAVPMEDNPPVALPISSGFAGIGPPRKFLKFIGRASHVLGAGAALAAEATGAVNLELERSEADRGFIDIALLAAFAAPLDPALYPPDAFYLRDADAKPQDKARIARVSA